MATDAWIHPNSHLTQHHPTRTPTPPDTAHRDDNPKDFIGGRRVPHTRDSAHVWDRSH